MTDFVFYSTPALERGLDGSDDRFLKFYFALYHCSPDEYIPDGINDIRERLSRKFPNKVARVGNRFVLFGEPAFLALTSYHQAIAEATTLGEEMRAYCAERVRVITGKHRQSQSLPIPIDLSEGQLAHDDQLELLTCIAIRNGQVGTRAEHEQS